VLLTVLGGSGAWPTAGQGCCGYLLEHAGFRLLIDPGYATLPRLLEGISAAAVDAVIVSHGHPDHCADLKPLLRARWLSEVRAQPLPIHALPGSIDPVLALDAPQMLRGSYAPHVFEPGAVLTIGPFAVESRAVPHFVPAVAFRITVEGISMVYTGDCGPCSDVVHLADQADLLVAEATFIEQVPLDSVGMLCSSGDAGQQASEGQVRRLVLTHLWPGLDPARARDQARQFYGGPTDVARPGLTIPLAPH
jgi:ribonuclease BN (tRNA processing enzyme)